MKDNVIRLYEVRPELALEQLKRATGLDFDELPQNLAELIDQVPQPNKDVQKLPPILTDIVDSSVR